MKNKSLSLKHLIILVLVIAASVLLVRHFHIKNFHIVKPGVLYVSGQPRGMDYTRLLYKYHIATIVNVRLPTEHRERNWYNEEVSWTRNNAVNYVELPIQKGNYFPDEQTQQRFLTIMADKKNLPLLVHGSSGEKRVPMLTAVWLVKSEGFAVEQVVEFAQKIKGKPLSETEIKFISQLVN
jgi:protein tyrosine/serine phosphatase